MTVDRRGGPSRTSQVVALLRAGLDRPHTSAGDPDAQRALCAGMTGAPADRWRDEVTERTRFFDEQVVAAISGGIRQVVIVGAGYDDRALRFAAPEVRYFELDHPHTQADKVSRVRSIGADTYGVAYVPADFGRDDVADLLATHGHEAAAPTLFICEGVLVYLDKPTIAVLLRALRSRAGPTSTLAVSMATHSEGLDSALVADTANARRLSGATEPWLTILPAGQHLALLSEAGWHADPAAGTVRGGNGGNGDPATRSLLVTARA